MNIVKATTKAFDADLNATRERLDVLALNPDGQAHYAECIRDGCNHHWAMILARRTFPGVRTDSQFFAGIGTLEKQFKGDPEGLQRVVQAARSKGYNPSPHDLYDPGMCRSEVGMGDPEAFVSQRDGRGEVQRRLKKRGWGSDRMGVKGEQREPKPDVALAPDIVERLAIEAATRDPSLRTKKKQEIREMIVEKHTRKKARNTKLV